MGESFNRGSTVVLHPSPSLPLAHRPPTPEPSIHSVDLPDVEDGYPVLPDECFLAKTLSKDVYDQLHLLKTEKGFSLDDIIQTEVDHPTQDGRNLTIPDSECFSKFSNFLLPVLNNCHRTANSPGGLKIDTNLDPDALRQGQHLKDCHFVSCRISTRRSIAEYPTPATCTRLQRRELFDIFTHVLTVSQPDYQGEAHLLEELSADARRDLLSCACQFGTPHGPPSITAGFTRDWPEGRGVWSDTVQSVTAHINTSDHLHLVYDLNPSNCASLYEAFVSFLSGMTQMEQALQYHKLTLSHHPTLGFLSSSPVQVGASLEVSVACRFTTLANCVLFDDILRNIGFRTALRTENSAEFSISYTHNFGESEVEFFQRILDQADKMAAIEELFPKQENIYHLLPSAVQEGSGKPLLNYPSFPDKTTTLAKRLTINKYLELAPLTTPLGFSLDHALQYGRDNPTDSFRFILGDSHTLETFGEVLKPVVEAVHGNVTSPPPLSKANPLLLNGGRGLSDDHAHFCYITARRNFTKFPFSSNPSSSSSQMSINDGITRALSTVSSKKYRSLSIKDFMGEYANHPLVGCLVQGSCHSLVSRDSGCGDGRKVWFCEDLHLTVISNLSEHVTIIVSRESGDMLSVYEDFIVLYRQLEAAFQREGLTYAAVDRCGFMTVRPHDFGLLTTSGILLHLPSLSAHLDTLANLFVASSTQAVATLENSIHLSSSTSLGEEEHQVVQRVVDVARKIIDLSTIIEEDETVLDKYIKDGIYATFHPDYPDLLDKGSLLSVYLTPEVYSQLVNRTSSTGSTLNSVIQVGVDQEECGRYDPGIVAGDPDCYDVFKELFDPIITHIHSCDSHTESGLVTNTSFDNIPKLTSISEVKIKLRCNLRGFPFPPNCSRSQRAKIESIITTGLGTLPGKYHPLCDLPQDISQRLTDNKFMAREPAFPVFVSSEIIRDWPCSRGVWTNKDCSVAVFVNGEDHICITSVSKQGHIQQAYRNTSTLFTALNGYLCQNGHPLSIHPKYGLLTTSPANIGCGLSVECAIDLPLLVRHPWLDRVLSTQGLRTVEVNGSTVVSSSVRSLGVDQRELLVQFVRMLEHLCTLEKILADGNCLYNTTHQPPHEDVVTCESDFPDFSHSPTSPLALSLDEGMFERLSPVATRGGTTLEDVIALGLYSPSHPVGVVLCDAECCSTFSELYRAVLRNVSPGVVSWKNRHKRHSSVTVAPQPTVDDKFVSVSYEYHYNLTTFPFLPKCTRKERQEVEEILKEILSSTGSATGQYLSLRHLLRKKDVSWDKNHVDSLTRMPDPSTGMTRDWPVNRGVYLAGGGVVASTNIDNHLKLSVTSNSEDVSEGYRKLIEVASLVEKELESRDHPVAFSQEDGYLSTCPTKCGSGLQIIAKLRLPKLARHPKLSQILKGLCMRMVKTLFVNEFTGESDNIAEIEFLPGHSLGEEETTSIFFKSLEEVCKIETTLQQGRKKKWASVPWPAFGTRHVK